MKTGQILTVAHTVWLTAALSLTTAYAHEFDHAHEDQTAVTRTVAHYTVPVITLFDQNRTPVSLNAALADSGPALVEFFFTTCTTFCDLRAARLAAVEEELAENHISIAFFSITTDPEFDTSERLRVYASRVKPTPNNWRLLTGPVSHIEQVETAFDARNPSSDKMLHQPLTFIRGRPGQPWIRLQGMMSSHDLAEHIKFAVSSSGQ